VRKNDVGRAVERALARHGRSRNANSVRDLAHACLQPISASADEVVARVPAAVPSRCCAGTHHRRPLRREAIKPGDSITVVRLDRLVRSSRYLANIMHDLAEMECGFVSLRETWCDTTTKVGRLLTTIMGGINQFERELIRERCEEGIARAKALGTKFGRRNALGPSQRRKVAQLHAKGATVRELAETYEVGVATIHRALNGP